MKLLLPLLSLAPLAFAGHSFLRRSFGVDHAERARHLSRGLSLSADVDVDISAARISASADVDVSTTKVGGTLHYDVVVSEGVANPDGGKERMVYLINGHYPAKPLFLDQGDDVEIFVLVNISEAMTMHFHGIDQHGTPWSDGVPGISQKPIQPGGNFTYRWNAHQHGLYQAHAHRKAQLDDGLFFPIFIRPAVNTERPFAELAALAGGSALDVAGMIAAEANTHILRINDWRHRPSEELDGIWAASGIEPLCADSVLINGQGSMVCPPESQLQSISATRPYGDITAKGCLQLTNPIANPFDGNISAMPEDMWKMCDATGVDNPLYTLEVNASNGSWASVGIVNTGGLWELAFSIDEHPLYVYAIDGQYVNTTKAFNILSVPSGVRYQAMIKLDKDAGSAYTIRAAANVVPQVLTGYGILQYTPRMVTNSPNTFSSPADGYPALPPSTASMDYTGKPNTSSGAATELDPWTDAPPFPAIPPLTEEDGNITLVVLDMSRANATTWAANHTGLAGVLYEDNDPLLWPAMWQAAQEAIEEGTGSLAGSALINATSITFLPNDTIVDIVIKVPEDHPPHPMHKHFNRFWVVGQGMGEWNFSSVAEAAAAMPESFNLVNPPVRDSYNTPVSGKIGSWLALRYRTVNPGANIIHCHITQHNTAGMTEVLLEGIELVQLPKDYAPSQQE
ncbi:Cupredoxin [Schizophyllum amplum]|uniref:Cupredoxin n=1 Tax=Schizophyllum amplum TaxID=97359 RepID=A0A550CYR5_9AGAR|nr:Cupredoxin [Auriculariopsis ampla]